MNNFSDRFGEEYIFPKGFIAIKRKASSYHHVFGGNSWGVANTLSNNDDPILLFVLDLNDPKLSSLSINGLQQLPIFSYINSDIWLEEQVYKINPDNKDVKFTHITNEINYVLPDEDKIPNPLNETSLELRDMFSSEYPLNENLYWSNLDEFLGGKSFIRVCGNPLWIQDPQKIKCTCEDDMEYVMGIGYEGYDEPFLFMDDKPFFFGETALYAFFCKKCLEVKIISQVT